MMYVQKTLTSGEFIIVSLRPTLRPLAVRCLIWTLVTLGIGLILTLPIYLYYALSNKFNEVTVTNRRIVKKRGIISYKTDEFLVKQIESVEVRQGLFGRMLGWGSVVVHGSGGDPMVCIVSDPHDLRRAIDEAIHPVSAPLAQ